MSKDKSDWFALELKADETYALCTCGLSEKMPYCDGSHKGTGLKSLKIVPDKDVSLSIRPLPYKVPKPEPASED